MIRSTRKAGAIDAYDQGDEEGGNRSDQRQITVRCRWPSNSQMLQKSEYCAQGKQSQAKDKQHKQMLAIRGFL